MQALMNLVKRAVPPCTQDVETNSCSMLCMHACVHVVSEYVCTRYVGCKVCMSMSLCTQYKYLKIYYSNHACWQSIPDKGETNPKTGKHAKLNASKTTLVCKKKAHFVLVAWFERETKDSWPAVHMCSILCHMPRVPVRQDPPSCGLKDRDSL